jgi:hypothetical protein
MGWGSEMGILDPRWGSWIRNNFHGSRGQSASLVKSDSNEGLYNGVD